MPAASLSRSLLWCICLSEAIDAPTVRAAFLCVHRGSLAMVASGLSTTGGAEGSANADGGTFSLPHTTSASLIRLFCVRLSTSSQCFRISPSAKMFPRGRFACVAGCTFNTPKKYQPEAGNRHHLVRSQLGPMALCGGRMSCSLPPGRVEPFH